MDRVPFCRHCDTTFESKEALKEHYFTVVAPQKAETAKRRSGRGGIFVDVDGDEYWAPSVPELEAEGFKVLLRYIRRYEQGFGLMRGLGVYMPGTRMAAKGGACHIILLAPDGHWAEGSSTCHHKDVYSKKVGYVLAVNHALSSLDGQLYSFDDGFRASVAGMLNDD